MVRSVEGEIRGVRIIKTIDGGQFQISAVNLHAVLGTTIKSDPGFELLFRRVHDLDVDFSFSRMPVIAWHINFPFSDPTTPGWNSDETDEYKIKIILGPGGMFLDDNFFSETEEEWKKEATEWALKIAKTQSRRESRRRIGTPMSNYGGQRFRASEYVFGELRQKTQDRAGEPQALLAKPPCFKASFEAPTSPARPFPVPDRPSPRHRALALRQMPPVDIHRPGDKLVQNALKARSTPGEVPVITAKPPIAEIASVSIELRARICVAPIRAHVFERGISKEPSTDVLLVALDELLDSGHALIDGCVVIRPSTQGIRKA